MSLSNKAASYPSTTPSKGRLKMQRKLKQWWPTILLISAKRTASSNLKPLNIKMTRKYDVENPGHNHVLGFCSCFCFFVFFWGGDIIFRHVGFFFLTSFKSFDFQILWLWLWPSWWRVFRKRVILTKLHIYAFIFVLLYTCLRFKLNVIYSMWENRCINNLNLWHCQL